MAEYLDPLHLPARKAISYGGALNAGNKRKSEEALSSLKENSLRRSATRNMYINSPYAPFP